MRFIVSALFSLLAFSLANVDYVEDWNVFKGRYGKTYSTTEEKKRYSIFSENMKKAAEVQLLNPFATFGITKFMDLTEEEFSIYSNSQAYYANLDQDVERISVTVNKSLVGGFDWRSKGAVTSVKDQGHCGSCWAFSAIGDMEGTWAIAGNKLTDLSEQEFVSCDYTSSGCQGGLMDSAFKWLLAERAGSIMSNAAYPYESADGTTRPCKHLCHGLKAPASDDWCAEMCYNKQGKPLCTPELCDCNYFKNISAAKIGGYKDLPKNEDGLKTYLTSNGPIAIGVSVPLGTVWQGYTGGVMTNCGSGMPNHGVLLVGYGSEGNQDYWTIKNSWGAGWGEKGYIRVQYGTNQCNLVFSPSSSTI